MGVKVEALSGRGAGACIRARANVGPGWRKLLLTVETLQQPAGVGAGYGFWALPAAPGT